MSVITRSNEIADPNNPDDEVWCIGDMVVVLYLRGEIIEESTLPAGRAFLRAAASSATNLAELPLWEGGRSLHQGSKLWRFEILKFACDQLQNANLHTFDSRNHGREDEEG